MSLRLWWLCVLWLMERERMAALQRESEGVRDRGGGLRERGRENQIHSEIE